MLDAFQVELLLHLRLDVELWVWARRGDRTKVARRTNSIAFFIDFSPFNDCDILLFPSPVSMRGNIRDMPLFS